MVAEGVTITVEILVVDLAVEVQRLEEKETLHQDVKVLVVVSEVTETQLQEKAVSEAKEALLLEEKVLLTELQDVLKVLVIHQDQEDQEETNIHC